MSQSATCDETGKKTLWRGAGDVKLMSLVKNHILWGPILAGHLDKQRNSPKHWVLCILDQEPCSDFSSLLLFSIPRSSHYFILMHCQMDTAFLLKRPYVSHISHSHSTHFHKVNNIFTHSSEFFPYSISNPASTINSLIITF